MSKASRCYQPSSSSLDTSNFRSSPHLWLPTAASRMRALHSTFAHPRSADSAPAVGQDILSSWGIESSCMLGVSIVNHSATVVALRRWRRFWLLGMWRGSARGPVCFTRSAKSRRHPSNNSRASASGCQTNCIRLQIESGNMLLLFWGLPSMTKNVLAWRHACLSRCPSLTLWPTLCAQSLVTVTAATLHMACGTVRCS